MWDALFKAVLVVLGTEVASKVITGKWAHEHLYDWWRELSERIDVWVKEHEELKIARVVGWVNRKLDHAVVGANRLVKVHFKAISSQRKVKPVVIEEVELSAAEVAAQFPDLQHSNQTLVAEY